MDINLAHGDYDDINIMSIRSYGRVGIGVISPNYNLQVNGNVFCSSTLSSGSDISCAGALTVGTTLTISNILFFDDETNTVILLGGLNKALIGLIKPSSGGITPTPYSTSGSAGDLVIRSDVNKKLILQTSTGAGGIIINNNNVGINTNAPKDKLDIYGGNLVIRSAAESGNSIIYLSTPFDNNSALKCAMIAQGISSWSKSKLHFCLDDTNDNTTSASTTNSRLCITSDGKVGINITAPLSDLHIHKNTANGESRIMLTDNTTGSTVLTQGFHLIKSVAQTCYLWNYYNSALLIGTNNAEAIRINTLGFVGIGGIEPRYKLDVYAGHLCARSSTNTGIAGVYLGTPDTPTSAIKTAIIAHGIGSSGISDLKFCINNGVDSTSVTVADVKMMLTSGGLLGIQNNSPKAPLSIGNASLVNSDGWLMMGKNNGSGGTRQFRIGADSSFRTCIGDIGNNNTLGSWTTQFLIEWAAPPSVYYNYQGNLFVTGWYYQHSDMKFKTNIKTIENSLIKILNLNGVSYTQKIEQTNHLGLIAQEVEGILPEVVSYDSEKDTKSISYTGIIPVLINAIKELNSIVLEQRNKINDLEQVLKKNNIF